MLPESARRSAVYVGDGTVTEFAFEFRIFDKTQIIVRVKDTEGSVSVLEADDYSVELGGTSGGTVTLTEPLADDWELLIESDVPYDQTLNLTNTGGFNANDLNLAWDRNTAQIQQLKDKIDRAVVNPDFSEETPAEFTESLFKARDDAQAAASAASGSATAASGSAEDAAESAQSAADTLESVTAEGETQVKAVQSAGTTQITAIGQAKDTAVQAVQTEGTTQKGLVTDEGTKQVGLVSDEGTKQVERVQQEGAKQLALIGEDVAAASESAKAAAASAQAASASATAANGSAKAAAGSASTASTAASTATEKASTATTAASTATTKADAASKSAQAASTSAAAAAGSATAAAKSAESIGDAETNAANSAKAAATSAEAAETAKTAAEKAAKDAQDAAGSVGDPIGRAEIERDYLKKADAASTYLGKTAKAESAKSADAVAWSGVSEKPTTVAGYGITFASTTEAEAGTDTTKPMNAAATKAAILALAPAPDLSGYLTKTDAASTYLGKTAKATSASTADTAAKLTTARTLKLTGDGTASISFDGSADASGALTLAASGASAGSYGPTADAGVDFGGTIAVPQVTVDAKGRVTSIVSRTITLPSGADLDDAATKTDILAAADAALDGMDVDPAGSPTLEAIMSSLSALETDVPQKLGQDTVHIVATWQSEDGLSWYRKYSDGWIEQGGISSGVDGTISFPTAFSSTNYTFTHSKSTSYNATQMGSDSYSAWNKTTSSITVLKGQNWLKDWYACGF